MDPTILITGATGTVGSEIVNILYAQAAPVRAGVVSAEAAAALPAPVSAAIFDFTDPSTFEGAFAGIEKLFLMRPPHISNVTRDMRPAIDYAVAAGVQHIVFLSLLGAEKNNFVPHAKVEKLLLDLPVDVTLLRCGFFMQNLATTHRREIREDGEIFIPAGSGKTAFIDARDIAAVAAKALTEAGHEQQAYALTGSEALDYHTVAAMMSDALGRPITYANPSPLRFAWRLWRQRHPLGYIAVVTTIYLTTRFGLAEKVTSTTAALLGRPPITMKQFLADYAPTWEPSAQSEIRSTQ